MIGYFQLYFRVVGDEETYYAVMDSDFSKPLTQEFLNYMLDSFTEMYNQVDASVQRAEFCTKEEYEKGIEGQQMCETKWGDGGKVIN